MNSKKLGMWLTALSVALMGSASAMADGGTVKGKVIYKGQDVTRTVLNTSKDPKCAAEKAKIGSFDIIVNSKTDPETLRNVLVYVKEGLGDKTYEAPGESLELTQRGCEYEPHVMGIMEGQTLKISNGDDTNHNIHFLPKVNEEINFSQPKKGMEKEITLVAEDVFKVKCDVHPWMAAYIGVFKHPFFTVTGKDGTFELTGLPAGTYTLEAWHESLGTQTMQVTLETDGSVEQDFTFENK